MTTPTQYQDRKGIQPRTSFATVLVGQKEEKLTVHEELLTFHSPYFRAALTGGFREAQDKTVTLKEEKGRIFEFFVHWLYYLRFPNKDDSAELYAAWTADNDYGDLKTENLIQLYVFCDKYNVPELKTKTMTEIFNHVEEDDGEALPSVDLIRFAFDNLPEHAPLCSYLVHAYCYWAQDFIWEDFGSVDWPSGFIGRVLARYSAFARGDLTRDDFNSPCDYHEHQSVTDRTACEAKQREEEEL